MDARAIEGANLEDPMQSLVRAFQVKDDGGIEIWSEFLSDGLARA